MALSATGLVPSANRRLPLPSTTGAVRSRYSSIRPCSTNVCARPTLPLTCSSRPGWRLSLATSAATSPVSNVEPFQDTSVRVRDATYLGRPLSALASGSSGSVIIGHDAAKIS
jgi:hypothetical protein